jgi:hypothetical protein
MKKYGFVSNSSTTSFMIYGISTNDRWGLTSKEFYDKIQGLKGYDSYTTPYDIYYFGKSLDKMKDDQTFGDFKAEVEKEIRKVFGDVEITILSDGWYDG